MEKLASYLVCLFLLIQSLHAQLSITSLDTEYKIDFDISVSGVNNGVFSGSGFISEPGTGQIDSDGLIVTGLSSGDMSFGSTAVSGDYTMGISSGGESTGGIYAFEVADGNRALGVQPTLTLFTPGAVILKVINATGGNVSTFKISYKIYSFNDQDRSGSFKFYYSTNDTTYFSTSTLDYTSVQPKDVPPSWNMTLRSVKLSAELQDGAVLYLKWEGDDAGGSGSRDEIALDDIVIMAYQEDVRVIISEVADNSLSDLEYVELFNGGSGSLDIEGWKLIERYNPNNTDEREITLSSVNQKNSGGTDYLKLDNGEYAVIVRNDPVSLKSIHSISDEAAIFENFWPPAMTGDERYQLLNALGDVIDNFGAWEYVDNSSFRLTEAQCYERTNDIINDGSSSESWSSTANTVYNYTPGSANNTQLPVELVFFDAEVKPGRVVLCWKTATEVNNYGFDIERQSIKKLPFSLDRRSGWKIVGFVQGHGNSYSPKDYWFTDYPDQPGKYLYRLKQIDSNGKIDYSDSITVFLPVRKTGKQTLQNYPNPFNPTTTIRYSIPLNSRQYTADSKLRTDKRKEIKKEECKNQASSIRHPACLPFREESSFKPQSINLSRRLVRPSPTMLGEDGSYSKPDQPIYPGKVERSRIIQSGTGTLFSVKLVVYDVLGREVAVLVNERQMTGEYEIDFDGRNLPSGIYFYTVETSFGRMTNKMILMK